MAHDPLISRRAVLQAAALGAGGLLLEACVPSASAPLGSAGPSPGAGQPSPKPSTTPAPSVAAVPLRRRIARLLVVGFRGLRVAPDDWIAQAIAVDGLGGVILFDKDRVEARRNVRTKQQVTNLVNDVRTLAPARELIVAIDQEGGLVTRLSPAYGFPAVASEAAIGAKSEADVRSWADGLAATLADVGVNLNLAPVVDLNVNPKNPAIGALGRSFSADAAVVAKDAAIEMQAHRARAIRTRGPSHPSRWSAPWRSWGP